MLVLALASLLALAAGTTWTVDDNGPADFPDISSAIASVAAGDTLLVEPGEYGAFVLGKRLTILGPAGGQRPHVTGRSEIVGATQVSLGGLRFDALTLWSLPGAVVVDDCALGPQPSPDNEAALEIQSCKSVLVSRSAIQGAQGTSPTAALAQHGLRVVQGDVTVADCTIAGGAGRDGDSIVENDGGNGGHAVLVRDNSHVVLAGCESITGGRSGECVGFVCNDGVAGDGVLALIDSLVEVRGSSTDTLDSGSCWCGPPFGGQHGYALRAIDGTAVLSGVSVATQNPLGISADSASLVVQPAAAQPYMELAGGLAAGAALQLRMHGPAGSIALLVTGPQLALGNVGGYEGSLWINPASLLIIAPVVLAGQDTPVVLGGTLPSSAGLEGLVMVVQAAHPDVPGALAPQKKLLGNAVPLLVRF